MKNREIIKESLLFPIKNYKYFIIVTILFLISEFSREYLTHTHNSDISSNIMFIISFIIPLIVLGISLQIIFHLINKKKGAPRISFHETIKEALQDTILESYYLLLALIASTILTLPSGIIQKIDEIPTFMSDLLANTEETSVFEIIGSLPDMAMIDTYNNIKMIFIIFIIVFVIFFSICTISKIDLNENKDYKQSFNIIRMLKIIKKIGIIKYMEFLLLIIIVSILIANIVFFLDMIVAIGSIFSAILESFSLFFFLHSFAKLYPE